MTVVKQEEDDWWYGTCVETAQAGWFPASYVTADGDSGIEVLKGLPQSKSPSITRSSLAVAQYYSAKFPYAAQSEDELTIQAGDLVPVCEKSTDGSGGCCSITRPSVAAGFMVRCCRSTRRCRPSMAGCPPTTSLVGLHACIPASHAMAEASPTDQQAAFLKLMSHFKDGPDKPGTVQKALVIICIHCWPHITAAVLSN